jgi:hypothetical protein
VHQWAKRSKMFDSWQGKIFIHTSHIHPLALTATQSPIHCANSGWFPWDTMTKNAMLTSPPPSWLMMMLYLHSSIHLHRSNVLCDSSNFQCRTQHALQLRNCQYKQRNKQTPWPESVSELCRPSDCLLLSKLVPIFADRVAWLAQWMSTAILGYYRPEPLFLLPSSSSIVLTWLSGLHSRPTTSHKIWWCQESNPGPLDL